MKPLLLNGHTRPLTQIRYNADGDLLFTAAKDHRPCVWYSHNGELLGTFDGHKGSVLLSLWLLTQSTGTVWSIDVSFQSDLCLTGSADNSCALWDVSNGALKYSLPTVSPVRTCMFSYDSRSIFFSTDKALKQPCTLQIFPISKIEQEGFPSFQLLLCNIFCRKRMYATAHHWHRDPT